MSNKKLILSKTFTCNYIEAEDRILFTINYEDFENRVDFWLTRAFLLKLLPHFFDLIVIKEDEIPDQSSNKSSTDTQTYSFMQKEPILLDSVDFKRGDKGETIIVFKSLKRGIFCETRLDQLSLNALVTLLTKTAPPKEWGIYKIN